MPFATTVFFDVSGGPLGLEPAIGQSGPGMALLLVLLVPLLYALPSVLMSAELASAMPHNGGYYVWVKAAFGEAAGFICSFWTLIYCVLDSAVYPVAAATVAYPFLQAQFHLDPATAAQTKYAISAGIVVVFTALNLFGIKAVGSSSVLFGIVILAPFLTLVVLALPKIVSNPSQAVTPFMLTGQSWTESAQSALAVVVWNYLGWDSLSTVAGEVHEPQKTIPKALTLTLPVIVALYVLSLVAGYVALPDPSLWQEGVWPAAAAKVGGPAMGLWMGASLIVSSLGLFTATLLGASRLPFVFAHDGLLPKSLARLHPKLGTPVIPILVVAAAILMLVGKKFSDLIEMDVLVYSTALMMEFGALVWLRIKKPEMPRPFKIPGGLPIVLVVALLPLLVLIAIAFDQAKESGWNGLWVALAFFGSGPAAYGLACLFRHMSP
ncbi:MAG: APC family permease, partial [bacterium]